MKKKLNIVLVHGAWGDGSHWREVIPILVAEGYLVRAMNNPLVSLEEDIQKTKNMITSLEGPTLLVGHSYGGMIISGAGVEPSVAGLVYIAAFAPDEGESISSIFAKYDASPGAAFIKPDAQGYLWFDHDNFHANF